MLATMSETKTEPTAPAAPRLWTPAGFREDEWTHADSADALAGNGRFILPLQVFLGLDPETRKSAKERLGVLLLPGDELEEIAGLLGDLTLVALAFPSFSDGRSFSKAELLQEPARFRGPDPRHRPGADRPAAAYAEARLQRVRGFAPRADQAARGRAYRRYPALLSAGRQAFPKGPEIFLAAQALG